MDKGGSAAPTGCYKCGRPGHWSRDCPSNPNINTSSNGNPTKTFAQRLNSSSSNPIEKPKPKQRRSRPKLTPDLLLSETTGIGYILRYFPKAFKCRGRGREVSDLRNLLRLYADWHSRLLPYYDFGQFIRKVEQVGTAKRVCLRELRERIADGVDPMNLHEPRVQQNSVDEGGADMQSNFQENDFPREEENNTFHEDAPQDDWEKVTQETHMPPHVESSNAVSDNNRISEEQKALMEANRLKALERAAARKIIRSAPPPA
ncbi:zinc knuckle family protein [Striga asiatica]|uniref:Zinc knuckle family protein n=1 Tax=Striga asiatica TaxID=4170 RepID=A0A5A7QSP9_STRAF|nr:zinc knuckle family protein [Striga asiatica]